MSHQQMFGAIQSQQPFQLNLSSLEEKYPLIEKQGMGRDGWWHWCAPCAAPFEKARRDPCAFHNTGGSSGADWWGLSFSTIVLGPKCLRAEETVGGCILGTAAV
ncbi:pentatricopeptide (PPR) repeat-containing protein [Actinidia rufa]|uniref:Pentatricopeptide (PPR) repeat-containing protein n=1 Tax=Actinidia rufa TaxID=165716 RepID=A0A7J0FSY5_9ERIC|nr:pentatricopeptide (PPR) repeat-containing protein [Actinidia rufa]